MHCTFIAEVKTCSPFGYQSDRSWDELFTIGDQVGDIISIHTDPRWGGSLAHIETARARTSKPILAKGIHATDTEISDAFRAGADHCLVVGRMPAMDTDRLLIEPTDLSQLHAMPPDVSAVWNARELATGEAKLSTFADARAAFSGWLCQASHIAHPADVHPAADAALVGTNLSAFAAALR